MKNMNKGFSLVEVIVAFSLLVILAAFSLPLIVQSLRSVIAARNNIEELYESQEILEKKISEDANYTVEFVNINDGENINVKIFTEDSLIYFKEKK